MFANLFERAGLRLGSTADCDVVLHDDEVCLTWLVDGSLGMGESYVAGRWDAARVDDVFCRLSLLPSAEKRRVFRSWQAGALLAFAKLVNKQTQDRARQVAEAHYDLGNDFFALLLG